MKLSRTTTALLVLGSAAFLLRVATVLAIAGPVDGPVAYEHGRIAENLLAGRGFTIELLGSEGPTAQQAPFYPLLLAGAYACFGVGTPAAMLAVQLLQCLAGTALVWIVVRLAWNLLPDRPEAGWVAGVGAALYPPHLYAVTHLQVALWAALALATLLALATARRLQRTWRGAILTGLVAGSMLLIEPILALAVPVAAAAFWLAEGTSVRSRCTPSALGRLATLATLAMLAILPWTVRNRVVLGEWIFVKDTFGYAFWQGNNPWSHGTDKIPKPSASAMLARHDGTLAGRNRALWNARNETLYIDDVLLKPTGYREFRWLSEPERCRLLGRRGWEFVRENPGRYARLCLQRLRFFLLFDRTNPKTAHPLYQLSTVTWLVLAGVGLLATLGRWRRLWPTYAVFAAITLFHTLVIASARFRIPIEPLALVWTGGALAPMLVHGMPRPKVRVVEPETPGTGGHPIPAPHFVQRSGAKRSAA